MRDKVHISVQSNRWVPGCATDIPSCSVWPPLFEHRMPFDTGMGACRTAMYQSNWQLHAGLGYAGDSVPKKMQAWMPVCHRLLSTATVTACRMEHTLHGRTSNGRMPNAKKSSAKSGSPNHTMSLLSGSTHAMLDYVHTQAGIPAAGQQRPCITNGVCTKRHVSAGRTPLMP
jgi:hypothetical protein